MVRRLPWDKELPSAWMAAMRPTPVMIPVNIGCYFRRLSQLGAGKAHLNLLKLGLGCKHSESLTCFERLKLTPPTHPGYDAQVITHTLRRLKIQLQRVV